MTTIQQKRGAIIAKRLNTINNFLIDKMGTSEPFGKYLASLGINEAIFFKDLPDELIFEGISKATPDSKNLMDYGSVLNLHLHHQKMIFDAQKEQILSADAAQDLSSAVVPANWLDYNADAAVKKPKPPVVKPKPYGTDEKGHLLHAANGNGLTPYDGRDSSYASDGEYLNAKGKFFKKIGEALVKAKDDVVKAVKDTGKAIDKAAKDTAKGAKITAKNVGKAAKKIISSVNILNPVTVVMRSAFLSLVALNIAGLASALRGIKNAKNKSFWNKFIDKWNVFGGSTDKLSSTIENGSNKKPFPPIKNKSKSADGSEELIDVNNPKNSGKVALGSAGALAGLAGVLASNLVTAPAAVYVASAGGVLAALSPILKSFAKYKGEDSSLVADLPQVSIDPDTDEALRSDDAFLPNFWDNYKYWIVGVVGLGAIGTIVVIATGKKNK